MSKIKIGVIGTGSISNEHIGAYLKNPDVELYAFCDINEQRVKDMAEKYGVTRTFTDMHEMLKLEEIDAVSVCTWNSQHAPCSIAALNAGKNVLCEKPMATSAEEAKQMMDAAQKNNKLLMIGFVRRFGNDCKIVKDFVKDDFFGDMYYTKASYLRRNGFPGGWFGDKSRSAGGPLIDLGVHVIDLVRYIMDKPQPVSVYGATFDKLGKRSNLKDSKDYMASSAQKDDVYDVEDLATAMIRFDNGAILHVEASFSLNIKKGSGRIELFGSKGGAKLDPELEMYTEMNGYMVNVDLDMPTALSFNGLFQNEINHYVDCVKNGTECLSPAQDGVDMMRILDAIYQSAKTGHEVIL